MTILQLPIVALAWLGRQGTRALAASIFLGLAMPQLADYVKPYLGLTVFVLLLFSYLRTDPSAFGRIVRAPGLAILAALWIMVALPLLFGTAYALTGLHETMPALYTIMILHIAIAPITSSAAFAALMGLDVAFSLAGLIVSSTLSPLTTVAMCYLFLGTALFSPIDLGVKLFLFFASSGAVAYAIHRIAGQDWIERQKNSIDGLSVMGVFIFAIAAMGEVPHYVLTQPLFALELLGFVVALTAALVGLSVLVFARIGIDRSLALGLLAAFRNLGVVMAALGATLPDTAWFFFALVQLPIYTFPALLKPLARRLQQAGPDI
ncbi:MAG: Na+-dependent transporter [Rhodopseudomonas sp.]|nr:Na+-dependent transporter [Rhodopseudomonas sp.]